MSNLGTAAAAFLPSDGGLYLDCAAQAPRLRTVQAAGRAEQAAADSAWQRGPLPPSVSTEQLRTQAARLFDGDADALALVPSASYGIATAARNLPLGPGEAVLVLEGQFPSNLLPWQQRCSECAARLVGVGRQAGQDWTSAVLDALTREPRIRIVALPQVRWDDGELLDLDRIAGQVQVIGAALVLDLSQSLGVLPTNLDRWQPDFVVSVGYKWLLGPRALAWLWAAPRWREQGQPIEQHWSARDVGDSWHFPVAEMPPYRHGARRFDAGGLDDPVLLAMSGAGLAQVLEWTPAAIADALAIRTGALDAALRTLGLADWITPGHAPHITALRPPERRFEAVSGALRSAGIACTHRHGLLRIAPHLHVDAAQMSWAAQVAASGR
ncbi:aminotransferase class V-fold PLP-dependent enzyme [soil metagenome]